MKKFVFKISVFCSIIILFLLAVKNFEEDFSKSNNYMAAIIDKHKIAESIKKPKLIFCGGSNLAFSINSKKIEQGLNMPVVNLGLHISLGTTFILNEVKKLAKKNDVVIISIEYLAGNNGNYELQQLTSKLYKPAKKFYSKNYFKDLKKYFEDVRETFRTKILKEKSEIKDSGVYKRNNFNEYGDFIAHLNKPSTYYNKNRKLKYKYWELIDDLNLLKKYFDNNNIEVYFLYPNYPKTEYNLSKETITKIKNDLSKNLNIETIGEPENFIFEDSLHFDTKYHLGKKARKIRTDEIIKLLKQKINNETKNL